MSDGNKRQRDDCGFRRGRPATSNYIVTHSRAMTKRGRCPGHVSRRDSGEPGDGGPGREMLLESGGKSSDIIYMAVGVARVPSANLLP